MLCDLCSQAIGKMQPQERDRSRPSPHGWIKSIMATLLVFLLMVHGSFCQEFSSSSNSGLNHMAVDDDTGIVYVGAVNALYQLDSSLVWQKEVDTSSDDGDNVNKVLVVASQHAQLVTCGTQLDGHCQIRQLDDISDSTSYDGNCIRRKCTCWF